MERLGLIGMLLTWILTLTEMILRGVSTMFGFSFFQDTQVLQRITLYLAICVSILTIMWYIGNMIMKREEFFKSLRRLWRDLWK